MTETKEFKKNRNDKIILNNPNNLCRLRWIDYNKIDTYHDVHDSNHFWLYIQVEDLVLPDYHEQALGD